MLLRRSIITVVTGLIAAIGAIFGATRVLETPGPSKGIPTRPVVVAARDIPEGRIIERASIIVARYPMGTVPTGTYAAVESVTGRIARVAIYKGETIVSRRLAPAGPVPIAR